MAPTKTLFEMYQLISLTFYINDASSFLSIGIVVIRDHALPIFDDGLILIVFSEICSV
jgi:hypothetical protein